MHGELSALLALGCVAALWTWSIRGREIVDQVSNRVCRELQVQRLDHSLTLRRVLPGPRRRRLAIRRIYRFEYSITGGDRRIGEICLLNALPLWARLDHPDGAIHLDLQSPSAR